MYYNNNPAILCRYFKSKAFYACWTADHNSSLRIDLHKMNFLKNHCIFDFLKSPLSLLLSPSLPLRACVAPEDDTSWKDLSNGIGSAVTNAETCVVGVQCLWCVVTSLRGQWCMRRGDHLLLLRLPLPLCPGALLRAPNGDNVSYCPALQCHQQWERHYWVPLNRSAEADDPGSFHHKGHPLGNLANSLRVLHHQKHVGNTVRSGICLPRGNWLFKLDANAWEKERRKKKERERENGYFEN